MATKTKIEWTDTTWNPVRGCTKISPGCKNCYAEAFAERFRGVKGHPYEQGFDLRLVPEKLLEPFSWSGASMVFVNSMSDLFHENVPDSYITKVARVMVQANWHVYQVLTKRSDRLRRMLCGALRFAAEASHIWWGVSVENVPYGVPRIADLAETPAAVKFLSIEPLLEDLGIIPLRDINWVIVGGESGRGARPVDRAWVESLLSQCRTADVPFFFKQWGGIQKKKNGREIDGRTFDEFPGSVSKATPDLRTRRSLADNLRAQFSCDEFYFPQFGTEPNRSRNHPALPRNVVRSKPEDTEVPPL